VTLLLRDPAAGTDGGHGPAPAPPELPACPSCGKQLGIDQDWCLNCGRAADGPLASGRPGKRTVAAVAALTLALCSGAVAAAYAALQKDTQPPPPVYAQAPAPPAAAPAVPPPAATPAPAPAPPPAASEPSAPATSSVPDTATGPTDVTPPAPSSSPPTTSASPATGPSTPTSPTKTTPAGKPKAPAVVPVDLPPEAAQLYDPYQRSGATTAADASAEPGRALDGNPATSWRTSFPADAQQVGVGLVVDLGKQTPLKIAELRTKTPGFRVEIYATDSEELPPDVLDTRWAHIKDVSDIGTSPDAVGKERIVLGGGSSKYRYLLLWVTTPPPGGGQVGISELSLLR
jgi:hypothetical protein